METLTPVTTALIEAAAFQPVVDAVKNNIVAIAPAAIAILAISFGLRFLIRTFHSLG